MDNLFKTIFIGFITIINGFVITILLIQDLQRKKIQEEKIKLKQQLTQNSDTSIIKTHLKSYKKLSKINAKLVKQKKFFFGIIIINAFYIILCNVI